MKYTIYIKGGYSNVRQEGVSGYIVMSDKQIVASNAFKVVKETSNRTELKAAIGGIMQVVGGSEIEIVSNNDYVRNILSKQNYGMVNGDLLHQFDAIVADQTYSLRFRRYNENEKDTLQMVCEMCNDIAGYDLFNRDEYFVPKEEKPKVKIGGSLFTTIYGNGTKKPQPDMKARLLAMRAELDEMIAAL